MATVVVLGRDRPRGAQPEDRDIVIEPGFTFAIKASAEVRETRTRAGYGEPVTVGEGGARRLGHRKPEPFVTG